MYDERGRQYLDCINNVAHVGHCHPHVVQAGAEQMSLLYTNSRYLHDNIVLYARRLTSYFPSKLSVCYFVNSGSEANDLALRLARNYTKHKDAIVIDDAYHGHLTSTTDLSPYKFKKISGGHKKWVHVADLPCSYRGKYTSDEYAEEEIGKLYANDVRDLINQVHNTGRNIAAFFAESIISCGGQIMLPKHYLKNVYRYVREAGGVCIADEVQTGFGRVGKSMWAFQLQGNDVIPDIITLGKPIGNGHPVAAVVTTPEIARTFEEMPIGYFNTYGGNPVSLAVANAVLDVIENESLMVHATQVGNYLLKSFREMMKRQPVIGDVRGEGLFIGIELVKNRQNKEPATEEAKYVITRLKEEKIIMSTDGIYENVLKFKPPMLFNMDDANRLLTILEMVLTEMYEDSEESIDSYEETSTDEDLSSQDA